MFWTNTAIDILLFFYVIDCVFMGLVIMMQRSKQEGLGAAFGSGMMSDTFGAQTSQVLVKATVWAAIFFFILSISLARLYSVRATFMEKGSPVQQELLKPVAPVQPAASTLAPAVSPGAPTNSASQPVAPSSTPVTPVPVAPVPAKASTQPAPAAPTQPAAK
jgi:protein translocase SecG subunit